MTKSHDVRRFLVLFFLAAFGAAIVLALGASADAGALGDAAKGKVPFTTFCVSCHGENGDGKGPAGAALTPKPRDFNEKALMNAMTDEYLIKVISEGGAAVGKSPLMAPWKGTLKDQEIKDVAAYVRTFAK